MESMRKKTKGERGNMSKNNKTSPRTLDLVMADQNWIGRLSYVEDVLFHKVRTVKRSSTWTLIILFFLILCIGIVSGIILYQLFSSLF
jgi:hypothetical protein